MQEDNQLRRLVDEHGHRKWSFIASKMNGRRGKQCRDRWLNHLKPDIRRGEWTQEEERILVEGHRMLGTRWAALAKLLPGRPENAIKNHWHATLRCKWAQRGGKISELQAYQHSLQLTNGGGGPGPAAAAVAAAAAAQRNSAAAAALGSGGAAAVAAAAAAAASKGAKPGDVPVAGAFDFDGAAAAAAVAAAAAAVVTGTAGAATGGTNSIARALDSIVASASAAGALGGLHSPSGSNTPLSAANLGVLGANFGALAASANVNVNGGDKSKKSDDEHALASMLGGLSQVLGTTASEADQEAILNMARSGIGTGGALTPAQAAAAAMQAAAVNTMQARQQAQQQQAAKAVKAAAAASERAVAARFAAKDAALNPPPIHNDIGDIIEATVEPLDLARYLDAVRDGDLSADTGSELATIVSSIKSEVNDGKQPLGESLAQHGALVEGALLRISSMIRKRWTGVRRMALVLRLGEAAHGDVSLIIACSAGKWRDAAGAAEHAAIEIKDKLIASIAPQCLSKQPVAAAALKAVAAATGRSPTDAEVAADAEEGAEEGAEGGAEGGADENEEDDNDEAAAAMDALAGFADAGDGPPAPTNAPLPLGKEKNPRLVDVEVKAEDSEPKGLDTPDERVHA